MPIVFDIGGVIFEDVWEGIFFKKHKGLVDTFDLDSEMVLKVCVDCWDEFSVKSSPETDWNTLEREYWQRILKSLPIPLSIEQCITFSKQFIIPVAGIDDLIHSIDTSSALLGTCSNQTAFWFERQYIQSKALQKIGRNNMILSFEQGATKKDRNNYLYNNVIKRFSCNAADIIYIEDREPYQLSAKKLGFDVVPFNKHEKNLASWLKDELHSRGVLFFGEKQK